jgi:hypothetical protein
MSQSSFTGPLSCIFIAGAINTSDISYFTTEVANSTSVSTGHHVAVTTMWEDPTLGYEKDAEGPFCDLFMPTNMAGFYDWKRLDNLCDEFFSHIISMHGQCEGLKYVLP